MLHQHHIHIRDDNILEEVEEVDDKILVVVDQRILEEEGQSVLGEVRDDMEVVHDEMVGVEAYGVKYF